MNFIRIRQENLGLWPRMALGISAGFLILFIAFAFLAERALQESEQKLLDERLVITQMVASEIDGLFVRAIEELSQAPLFADFDPHSPDLSDEENLLKHTYGEVGMFNSGIVYLDENGNVILSHPPKLYELESNLSSFEHIKEAIDSQTNTISDPFINPINQQPVVAITVPLYHEGEFVGLLSGLVRLDESGMTAPLFRAAFLGNTAHAILVDENGQTLTSTFHLPFLSPGEHISFYQEAISKNQPVVEIVPFELELPNEPLGHLHVMAFVPLKNVPWGVSLGGDVGPETFASVQKLRYGLILLGFFSFITVWVVTLFVTRKFVQPVRDLTAQAEDISSGNLDRSLQITEGGELGVLATSLEKMRLQLLKDIDNLENLNQTLEVRVDEQTDDLRQQQAITQNLLRQVITAQEMERARLSHELHDEIGQMLTAVELSLNVLNKSISSTDLQSHEKLEKSRVLTQSTITELRRIIAALRPGILDQLGLIPALDWMGDYILRPHNIEVILHADKSLQRLPQEIETILFRITQEAINNVARHSEATQFTIKLEYNIDEDIVTLILSDDGKGFNIANQENQNGQNLGIEGMKERASLAGGSLIVQSELNKGTIIEVSIPVPQDIIEETAYETN